MREETTYKGRVYYRYPKAKASNHRKYFRRAAGKKGCTPISLHREVWEEHNGSIPEGFHVHHKNEDPSDNDIGNLECVDKKAHMERHRGRNFSEENLANLSQGREKALEWRRSPEGKAWYKKHGEYLRGKFRKRSIIACSACGKTFYPKEKTSKFCSRECYGEHQAILNCTNVCSICGKAFPARNEKVKLCSVSCRNKDWHRRNRKKSG